ncbi:MAG TPA: ABC transporter [Legionellales bacterium]|nr:ABC transporter [Legionellales bacterium]
MSVFNQVTSFNANAKVQNKTNQQKKALQDFFEAMKKANVWILMAWQDIQFKYRRSTIGPFWITLSMAIMVYTMGFLYSYLWHLPTHDYFTYLATGMIAWNLISTILIEATDTYLVCVGLIRQIKMPYFLYMHRMCTRNFIIFGHNILIMIPIYLIYANQFPVSMAYFLLPIHLFVLYFNAILFSNVIAMICARYRDIGQIIKSFIQILFFLTPVMWKMSALPPHIQNLMQLNPFYHYVELIRCSLLGVYPSEMNYLMMGIFTGLGILMNQLIFVRYRSRIVYWL